MRDELWLDLLRRELAGHNDMLCIALREVQRLQAVIDFVEACGLHVDVDNQCVRATGCEFRYHPRA